jgi:predicted nucleic acid-binding protein
MRLVQRNGRVDRIGSKHDIVHLYTFFPDQYLDTLLDLEANLRRKIARPLPVEEIRQIIQDYLSWEIVVNTPNSTLHALEIEVRYQISFWDALILHAAESASAPVVYSEDLGAGQKYGPVRIVNPLLG